MYKGARQCLRWEMVLYTNGIGSTRQEVSFPGLSGRVVSPFSNMMGGALPLGARRLAHVMSSVHPVAREGPRRSTLGKAGRKRWVSEM